MCLNGLWCFFDLVKAFFCPDGGQTSIERLLTIMITWSPWDRSGEKRPMILICGSGFQRLQTLLRWTFSRANPPFSNKIPLDIIAYKWAFYRATIQELLLVLWKNTVWLTVSPHKLRLLNSKTQHMAAWGNIYTIFCNFLMPSAIYFSVSLEISL